MNETGIKAIKTALANAEDNLCRARMQKRAMPNWSSGNGETIDELITAYEKERDQLLEALQSS